MYEITWRSFTPERLHFECNGVNCPETRKIQKGQKSLNEGKTVVRSWLSNIIVSAGRIMVRNVSPSDKLLFHHHHHQSVLTIIKPPSSQSSVLVTENTSRENYPAPTQPLDFWHDIGS